MINISIQSGIYPSILKHAKVIPVFKTGDVTESDNYRPISLLSNLNKILEKVMYKRFINFIENKNILHHSQYGFRQQHSTQHAILDIVNKIQANIDKKEFTCGIFIDLKKAFDTVDHTILLCKLQHYGFRGIIHDWLSSYLTNRFQTTQIESNISTKEKTLCGVPQGSVLGPLLFLIYINDIHRSSDKFNFHLFADDTNLLYSDKNPKTLEYIVNTEFAKVYDWLQANKLAMNFKKSNFVMFYPYQKNLNYQISVSIFDKKVGKYFSLERKEYLKYLGVLFDEHLTWKHHIDYVASKISKTVGIIARLRHFVPFQVVTSIYRSLILPYLSYGITIWGNTSQIFLKKLLVLQKRVLRIMHFANNRDHAVPFFKNTTNLPVNMLYFESVSKLMYDVNNDLAPKNITDLFTQVATVHTYGTRASIAGNYQIKYSRTTLQKNAFSRVGAKIWNSLPKYIRNLKRKEFAKEMHTLLLNILNNEDDYLEVPMIMQRMSV